MSSSSEIVRDTFCERVVAWNRLLSETAVSVHNRPPGYAGELEYLGELSGRWQPFQRRHTS